MSISQDLALLIALLSIQSIYDPYTFYLLIYSAVLLSLLLAGINKILMNSLKSCLNEDVNHGISHSLVDPPRCEASLAPILELIIRQIFQSFFQFLTVRAE